MEHTNDAEENFHRVIHDNFKYAFNSPKPTVTGFPTPFSRPYLTKKDPKNCAVSVNELNNSTEFSTNTSSFTPIETISLPLQNIGNTEANHVGTSCTLNDMNVHPSSVLNFENFANEFLLAPPEQFRDFLLESPAALSFWQSKTPAKTPLKFSSHNYSSINNTNVNTPLQNIDVNLMFNSGTKSIVSPKKYLTLTPYGRKVLTDIGTPYARMLASSNSALVDFQKARKEQQVKTPKVCETEKSVLISTDMITCDKSPGVIDDDLGRDGILEYGSSPTTIQLNSSVTKSAREKLGCSPEVHRHHDPNIDDRLFNITVSPTPKLSNVSNIIKVPELPKMGSFKSDIPQLIGSKLKSKTKAKTKLLNLQQPLVSQDINRFSLSPTLKQRQFSNSTHTQVTNQVQQPKFQIIVTDATTFNASGRILTTNKRKLKRSKSTIVSSEVDSHKKRKKNCTSSQ